MKEIEKRRRGKKEEEREGREGVKERQLKGM